MSTNFCDFCQKEFYSKGTLTRHQKTSKSCRGNQKEVYKCEFCEQKFTQKKSLSSHLTRCSSKITVQLQEKYRHKIYILKKDNQCLKTKMSGQEKKITNLKKIIGEKDQEISALKVECEKGKTEVYDKVCTKVLDKSTVTNNTNTAYFHPKLVNLPITNIHPLTSDYVKDQVDNGNYTFDHYLKGENGLVDFIYSITMCENDDGDMERNYVCTDPSRDSYHRLVETKEWQKDKGGKFVDVILDTLSDRADCYHMKVFDERNSKLRKPKLGYDPDYIYKLNTDMHTGIVQTRGKNRRTLRQRIKKETSRKISV
jgi:hypothetical protein